MVHRIGSNIVDELTYIKWLEDYCELYARRCGNIESKSQPKSTSKKRDLEEENQTRELIIQNINMNRERRKIFPSKKNDSTVHDNICLICGQHVWTPNGKKIKFCMDSIHTFEEE